MFKLRVLPTLSTLPAAPTESQLRDRPSFLRFVGLARPEPVPDAKTVRLFREQLTRAGAIGKLFARFEAPRRDQGVLAPRPAGAGRRRGDGSSALCSMGGQIVDATMVQARPARLTAEEQPARRRGETPAEWRAARRAPIDRDRRWTLRRGRKRQSLEPGSSTQRQATAIAAAHDGGQLGAGLDTNNTASGVWADTAYRSAANLDLLARRGRGGHLQRAKPKGKPMPAHLRRGNARRGKIRAALEHVFAAQQQRLRLVIRTIGLARATAKIGLANLASNRLRVTWLHGRAAPA